MEWYVYRHDTNKGKIIKYNVVNTGVINHLIEMLNQIKKEKGHWCYDDFTEAAVQIYRYYYWGKCEHEIIIKEWVGKEAEEKVDVFDQLMLNWDIFVDHLYDYVIELMSSKGEEENEECPEDCLCRTCAAAKDCDRLIDESCCGCRKTEDDMVTRCISFVGEEDKTKNKCENCQCSDCTYKDTILFCPGCNYCENGNDFIPKGECCNYVKEGCEDIDDENLVVAAINKESVKTCETCQCQTCSEKEYPYRCPGCKGCEDFDAFIEKGSCGDYQPKEDAEESVEEKPIIEDCLEDCLCKRCEKKEFCGCIDCTHSIKDIVKSCWSFIGEEENEPTCDSAWWIADSSRGAWICANCKSNALYWNEDVFLSDFCPHCGARMENCSCGQLKEEER